MTTEHEDPATTIARLQANLADAERRVQLALTPDAKALLARKDSDLWQLRQQLERAERAAGRCAAEAQGAIEERDRLRDISDEARLAAELAAASDRWNALAEALGVEGGLPNALERCLAAVAGYREALARKSADAVFGAEPTRDNPRGMASIRAYMAHMQAGGVVEHIGGCLGRQRRIRDGVEEVRDRPEGEWRRAAISHRDEMDADCYRLLPIDQSEAKP